MNAEYKLSRREAKKEAYLLASRAITFYLDNPNTGEGDVDPAIRAAMLEMAHEMRRRFIRLDRADWPSFS